MEKLPFGICWGTLVHASLPDLIAEAGRNGFGTIAPGPPQYRRARARGLSVADLRGMLHDSGVRVTIIDALLSALPGSPAPHEVPEASRENLLHDEDYCYEMAEALEADAINVVHHLAKDVPIEQLIEAVGEIAQRAARRGFGISIEFVPTGAIPNLLTAARIVEGVRAPNVGVLLDAWHHARTGGTLDQIAALPPGTITAFQLSDRIEPPTGTDYPPRAGRLFPGDGALPLTEIVRLVQANNPRASMELEIFSAEMHSRPTFEAAAFAAEKCRTWLAGAGSSLSWAGREPASMPER